jgi:hypothetical protein
VPASADRVTGHPEQSQDHADDDDDDAERPENGDPGDEADNQQKNAEDNYEELLAVGSRSGTGARGYPGVDLLDDAHGGLPPAS